MPQITLAQAVEMALAHQQAGRLAEAEAIYAQVVDQYADRAEGWHDLGVLAYQAGRVDVAIELTGRAVRLDPTIAVYQSDLGEFYRQSGRRDEAFACLRRALALDPELFLAHTNLGLTLMDEGRYDEAVDSCRRAVERKPDYAEGHNNLGNALSRAGRRDLALAAYQRATELKPDFAEAHGNLGAALYETGRGDEAIAAYRRAIVLRPGQADAHANLGVALARAGRRDEALAAFNQAIALKPDHAQAQTNLGNLWNDLGQPGLAIAAFHRAITLKPALADPYCNLGNLYREQGRLDEALAAYRKALEVNPEFSLAGSNLLLTLYYHPGHDARAILAEHRQWAKRFADPLAAEIRPHPNDRTPDRRLRIGLVSPDFRSHPVGSALLALFPHRDRQQTELHAYSDVRAADRVTEQLKALADRWHDTLGLGNRALADRIREDRIDILVDLALHTANHRMLVFARKPAPVQVTMLGMPGTTGLGTIDYRLTDSYLDPPGTGTGAGDDADSYAYAYAEQSIRLPHSFWLYPQPDDAPAVGPLPAERNGFVTFGCLNQFAKVTRPVLDLWVKVLRALPGSRLLVQCPPGGHRHAVRALFRAGGIAPERLELVAKVPHRAYLERFGELDLALDPFPYNGHTSTLDALWMGVPVVTLAGRTAVGRGGVSILSNAGLTDWIARTPEEYLDLALRRARDLPGLALLRAGLRARMRTSPLMDGPSFSAALDAAFRRMWQAWCTQGAPERSEAQQPRRNPVGFL